MHIKRVEDICVDYGLKYPDIRVCSNDSPNFTMTRAQLLGCFYADIDRGPCVISSEHDSKCMELLDTNKKSDIILFPEYCISYDLVEKIVNNSKLWPNSGTLWCLPCQGISFDEFFLKMEQFSNNGAIVIETGIDKSLLSGNFINAMIYCFIAETQDPSQDKAISKLVLLPQLKTKRMPDLQNNCESHMTVGNTIFVFGYRGGNCLISLICADSMNENIVWRKLIEYGQSLILLHPQLNPKPTHPNISRLRNEIFDGTSRYLYITANWAKGTIVDVKNADERMEIKNPWSCIYFKYEKAFDFEKWRCKHENLLRCNTKHLLYGCYMQYKRVAVWYAWFEELVQNIMLQKPFSIAALTQPDTDVTALECVQWDSEAKWSIVPNCAEARYRYDQYITCLEESFKGYDKLVERFSQCEYHEFPFTCGEKTDVDRFLELLLAKNDYEFTKISNDEILCSPVILLDESNIITMCDVLSRFRDLIDYIDHIDHDKGFPPHLSFYSGNYRFELSEEAEIPSNITTLDAKERMILSVAKDENEANRYLQYLEKNRLSPYKDSPQFPLMVCILARDIRDGEYRLYYRTPNKSPTNGNAYTVKGTITNGGQD